MNKANKNVYTSNKTGKSTNANEKSLTEVYIGLTLAIHFLMITDISLISLNMRNYLLQKHIKIT